MRAELLSRTFRQTNHKMKLTNAPSAALAVLSCLAYAKAAALPELDRRFTVGQGVKTSSGTVVGQQAAGSSGVSEYLGIPFAQPPIGNLRFAAPQPFTGTGTINATAFVRCRVSCCKH